MKQNVIIACLVLIVLGLGYIIFCPNCSHKSDSCASAESYAVAPSQIVVEKLDQKELENMINARSNDLLAVHPQISKNVELVFDNLKEGEKKPVTFDAIFEKLIMTDWESVQVTSVHYASSGKIDQVTMHIKHTEF